MEQMIYLDGEYKRTLDEAMGLNRWDYPLVSIVGGGGKTSTMNTLAADFAARGLKYVMMTTTNMFYPESEVYNRLSNELETALNGEGPVWIGDRVLKANGRYKLAIPDERVFEYVMENRSRFRRAVLNEADGAKQRPIKVPRDYEPVIPEETDVVAAVVGMDAVERPIYEVAARPDDMAVFLGKETEELLTIEDIARIVTETTGYYKDVRPTMEFQVIINKVDDEKRMEKAMELADRIRTIKPGRVILTKLS